MRSAADLCYPSRVKKSNAVALARYASQLTGGGREMINILVTIARDQTNTPSERRAAACEVLDRTCGKAPIMIESDVQVSHTANVAALSVDELADLRTKLLKMAGPGAPAPLLPAARPLAASPVIDVEGAEPDEETWEDEP